MRSAPAVQVPAPGGGAWPRIQIALYAVAAAQLSLWAALGLGRGTRWSIACAAAAGLVAAWLAARGLRPHPHDLRWDGAQWLLDMQPAGPVAVTIDLGAWLLLRLDGAAAQRPTWLALSRRDVGSAWHGLRAALYGAQPRGALHPDSSS
jgi:hypothetical protein